MTKEKLMEWGLTEEQANKVMEGLNGSFVTKARFNEVNTELTKAKTTITERDGQLEALKKSGADATALQEQITQLQADNKKKDADHAAELKALKISNAVELALTGAKAKNTVAVKALLADVIAKAELAEDGTVKGLDDEVKKLVEGKDTAFLFDKATEKKFKGAKSAEKGDGGGDGSMTLEKFRGLSPAERYDFSVNHPDEYKNLYGGNE
jgi:septal ring factor EnvC (AmiA/AmiB activator)|nr:MAG TPA: minor structural protein [Caudoviricetes sp.]